MDSLQSKEQKNFMSAIKAFIRNNKVLYKLLVPFYKLLNPYNLEPVEKIFYAYYKRYEDIFFIQVGSNNGKSNDPLYRFVTRFKWRGILIEPVPHVFQQLKRNYKDFDNLIFENVAISNNTSSTKFYRLKTEGTNLPGWYDQLGSFNKEVILTHKKYISDIEDLIVEENVQVLTFRELKKKYGFNKINILHLDTEGYDYEILKTIDWNELLIDLILFEHIHLSSTDHDQCIHLLNQNNYLTFKFGDDTLCIRKELKEVASLAQHEVAKTG